MFTFLFFFFFSSRRRHTRLQGDWSSDVCSSDLITIFGKNMTVSLIGLTIENGEANQGGGVDNAGGSTMIITDSTISGNAVFSGSEGGGIFNNGTVTISDSTITGNSAPGGGQGGGIYDNGTESITDSTISD